MTKTYAFSNRLKCKRNEMEKRLLPTLLIIIFVFASVTPLGITLSIEQNDIMSSNYDRTYTLNIEHENHRSKYTLYVSVPPSLYDYYRSKTHSPNGEREYAKFVTPDAVKTIAKNIRNITSNRLNSDEEFANDVLMFVRQIPYSVSGLKYPIEAIVDNSGDCDVSSYLAASIMKAGGLDVVLIMYRGSSISHMNVGVYLPHSPLYATSETGPFSLEYNNKTYWITETTPSGNWKVGELPDTFANLNNTVISLEKQEASSPAYVSSSINNPLKHSSISIALSSEKATIAEKEWSFMISGSISPHYSEKSVVLYVSKDGSSYTTFRTATEKLGNYSLSWNVTSPGTYSIRTSLLDSPIYAGSDSETITVIVGSYPQWIGNEPDRALAPADILGYNFFSSRGFNEFLKHNLTGTNVSLSGEFMVLNNGQTAANSEYTMTIPERVERVIISRRQIATIKIPEQTVKVQGSKQASNQLGFILHNDNGYCSAVVRLLDNSDLTNIEEHFGGNNATYMNATTSIKENVWYKAVAKISNGEMSTELHTENGTILRSSTTKDNTVGIGESGIFITVEPYNFIAFKNLQVENLDQPSNQTVGDTPLPVNELEPLTPYGIMLIALLMLSATITYLGKD
jgi:hypothetical protein